MKKKVQLKELGKVHTKEFLKHYHPFLKGKFRNVLSTELKSEKVLKRGKQKGVQMYQCKSCVKWYSETTGTALWDIKLKTKWQGYLRCM